MKNIKMRQIILIILFLFIGVTKSFCQNKFKELTITGGVSYNLLRGVYKIPFSEYEKSFKFTLGQQLNFDYALLRRFSLGGE